MRRLRLSPPDSTATIDTMRRWLAKRGEAAIDAVIAYILMRLLVIAALFAFDFLVRQSFGGLSAAIAALVVLPGLVVISVKKTPELGF
jgi:hypothetical protein